MIEYENSVYCVDAQYMQAGVACLYIVCHNNRIAIIETGTTHSVPYVLDAIKALGMTPEAVDYIIPTHVHLDHAGGAGALIAQYPNAHLLIHPCGKRHMVDPIKLVNATIAVYGQKRFEALYGTLVPVDETRVSVMKEGDEINLAGRIFKVLDTPGHARHHVCLWDETSGGMFTGDTGGLSYRALDGNTDEQVYLFATTTPTQFDPEALHDSVNRIMQYQPQYFYLTHFGRIAITSHITAGLHQSIDAFVAIAKSKQQSTNRQADIAKDIGDYVIQQVSTYGIDATTIHSIINNDMQLNAQGLDYWLATQVA